MTTSAVAVPWLVRNQGGRSDFSGVFAATSSIATVIFGGITLYAALNIIHSLNATDQNNKHINTVDIVGLTSAILLTGICCLCTLGQLSVIVVKCLKSSQKSDYVAL
jgi:hypothetical protein